MFGLFKKKPLESLFAAPPKDQNDEEKLQEILSQPLVPDQKVVELAKVVIPLLVPNDWGTERLTKALDYEAHACRFFPRFRDQNYGDDPRLVAYRINQKILLEQAVGSVDRQ